MQILVIENLCNLMTSTCNKQWNKTLKLGSTVLLMNDTSLMLFIALNPIMHASDKTINLLLLHYSGVGHHHHHHHKGFVCKLK